MHYSVSESEIGLVHTEEDDVPYLAIEDDGEHPYIHFPHCKIYLVLSIGWIFLITLSVPIAIGYARYQGQIEIQLNPARTDINGLTNFIHCKRFSIKIKINSNE